MNKHNYYIRKNGGNILISLLKFLIVIVFLVILFQFAKMYSIKMMNSFFNKEETKVPNLISQNGMPVRIEEAFELCKQYKLRLDIKDKRHDNNIPEGCIISQDPPPDTIVKANRIIEIVLSLGPKTIMCPDVTGKDVRDIAFLIQKEGFTVGKKSYIYSNKYPVDTVIAQTPEGGKPAPKGVPVDVLVSQGPISKTTKVPNCVGKNIEAVKIALTKLNLTIGKIEYKFDNNTKPNTVILQSPQPNTTVLENTPINFVVSTLNNENTNKIENNNNATDAKNNNNISLSTNSNELKQVNNIESTMTPLIEKNNDQLKITPDKSEPTAKTFPVKFVVPPGSKGREIKIVLLDDIGPREIYKNIHYPGEEISTIAKGYGKMKILIYLDNVFFKDIEVGD